MLNTNHTYQRKTIAQWLEAYEKGFNESNLVEEAGWICWQNEVSDLVARMPMMYETVKLIADSGKFDVNAFYVRLKEVSYFSANDIVYANVIISQELNQLPVLVLTPDINGVSELFLINNKHKVVGTMEEMKTAIVENF